MPQTLPPLPDELEECIYRVAQEATANVVQHANARNLVFRLRQGNGWIMLTIHDDGAGFDPTELAQTGHYGLPGMWERARMAGGTLKIQSEPGQGTVITLNLPTSER